MMFSPGYWLNDQCINFYYEYLSSLNSNSLLFLDPSTVFLMMFEDDIDDLKQALDQLSLETRDFIFCPINDSNNPRAAATGSH